MDFLVYGDRDTQVGDLLREIGVPYGPREMAAFNRLDDLKRAVGEQPDLVKERFRSPFAGEGPTLLGIALEKGHRDMAKFLIEAGAPLDTVVYQNMTLLHMAARGGDPELIRLLVARGLDVHARDRYQDTPLRDIAWAGKPDAIAALLEAGADVNTRGMNDYTPLHTAVSNNRVEIVRMLLAAGADATIPDSRDHETALDVARRKNGEYAKWPANRPLPDSGDGAMPLDVARKKNSDIVKLLEEAVRTKPPSDRTSTK
jgi:ankyrin repeat protein